MIGSRLEQVGVFQAWQCEGICMGREKPKNATVRQLTYVAAWILAFAFSALLLAGCAVRLIGDYDDTIDSGVTDVQREAELYFSKLQSSPATPYDQALYDDIDARLAVLKTRAASLPKYPIILEQLTNLKSQFDTFQKLDKATQRPFPSAAVADAESAVAVSVESILKLELALKARANVGPSPTKPSN
jgi:hypothetical protein